MVLVKATEDSEKGEYAGHEAEFAAMGRYNEELLKAGIMLAGEGLTPSSQGKRLDFGDDGGSRVIDGPFAETKEALGGYYLIEAADLDEALAVAKQVPTRFGGVEVRPVWDMS